MRINLQELAAGVCKVPSENAKSIVVVEKTRSTVEEDVCPSPTVGAAIDVKKLIGDGSSVFQVTMKNETEEDQILYLGGVISTAGSYVLYGTKPTAVDFAGMVDEFGAQIPRWRGMSQRALSQPFLVESINVFASDAQKNQSWNKFTFDFNTNDCKHSGRLARLNTEDNYVTFKGIIPVSPGTGASYKVLAGEEVTIELVIGAIAEIYNFRAE